MYVHMYMYVCTYVHIQYSLSQKKVLICMHTYVRSLCFLFICEYDDGQHRKCILFFNFKIIISFLKDAYIRMYVQY